MIKVEKIEDKNIWDEYVKSQSPSNILQSWAWGDFQEALGRKIWRVGVYEQRNPDAPTELLGVALAQLIPTKLRTHIYLSNGPAIDWERSEEILPALIGYFKAVGIQEKAKFVRMDPLIKDSKPLENAGLKKSPTHVQAEYKWMLDISKEENLILKDMKKNARYEIKRGIKEGTVVKSSTDIKDFDKFEKLFLETVKRQKFVPQPISYLKKQFEVLSKTDNYKVYWAEVKGKVVATALISTYGDTSSYLHAASDNSKEYNNNYAPRVLLWQAIKDSKERGGKWFDFYGIAETDDPKDPWAGFTRFKKSFGGSLFKVVRAHDIPIAPFYFVIRWLEATRELWGGIYYKVMKK